MKLHTILLYASTCCVTAVYAAVQGDEAAIITMLGRKPHPRDTHLVVVTNQMTDSNGKGMTIGVEGYLLDRDREYSAWYKNKADDAKALASTTRKYVPHGRERNRQGREPQTCEIHDLAPGKSAVLAFPKSREGQNGPQWAIRPVRRSSNGDSPLLGWGPDQLIYVADLSPIVRSGEESTRTLHVGPPVIRLKTASCTNPQDPTDCLAQTENP